MNRCSSNTHKKRKNIKNIKNRNKKRQSRVKQFYGLYDPITRRNDTPEMIPDVTYDEVVRETGEEVISYLIHHKIHPEYVYLSIGGAIREENNYSMFHTFPLFMMKWTGEIVVLLVDSLPDESYLTRSRNSIQHIIRSNVDDFPETRSKHIHFIWLNNVPIMNRLAMDVWVESMIALYQPIMSYLETIAIPPQHVVVADYVRLRLSGGTEVIEDELPKLIYSVMGRYKERLFIWGGYSATYMLIPYGTNGEVYSMINKWIYLFYPLTKTNINKNLDEIRFTIEDKKVDADTKKRLQKTIPYLIDYTSYSYAVGGPEQGFASLDHPPQVIIRK
jgi:hypothetical protein